MDESQRDLWERFIRNECTTAEIEELLAQFNDTANEAELRELISVALQDEITRIDPTLPDLEQKEVEIYAALLPHIREQRKSSLWPRIAVAASIIVAIGIGGYFALHKTPKPAQWVTQLKPGTFKNDAQPGNKAILTLGNGQQLTVTSLPAGHITNSNAQKTANGELVYNQSGAVPKEYNTFTVPRGGGKHEIRLADGTLAVLDAESSIRFPVAFNGKDRRVTITGQVYFEVVHKTNQEFFVTAGDQTIEDIGTHFNVNAFDGKVKTTLIEGSIKVNDVMLQPGQQAVENNGKLSVNDHIDEEEVLAWKNGLFKFGSDASLETVMNQLSRWYDLDVVYQGPPRQHQFGGIISRDLKLSSVCKILAISGVQFSLDGKKITVYQ